MSASRVRFDRVVLGLGLIMVIGALIGIFVEFRMGYAVLEQGSFRSDPTLGIAPTQAAYYEAHALFVNTSPDEEFVFWASGVALLGLALIGVAARRLGRRSGLSLGPVIRAVSLPLALGLVAGLFMLWPFDDLLESLFETLWGRRLPITGGCTPSLTLCSRVQALESVWTLAIAITCVLTTIAFMRAARVAWRAGEAGKRLPERWANAAIALFGIGALSLVASSPYAADHAREAAECSDEYDASIPNWTSTELQGRWVESCGLAPWADFDAEHAVIVSGHDGFNLVSIQAYPDGWVSALPEELDVEFFTPEQLAARVNETIGWYRVRGDAGGEKPVVTVLGLYIDERTPALAIREHLRAAQSVGIDSIVLFGQTQEERSLETVGTWARRRLCPVAWIRIDAQGSELSSFATWGEILDQAIALDPEPLHIRL